MKKEEMTPEEKAVIEEKLQAMDIPGAIIEFTPEEADYLGFMVEDAMSWEDAVAGALYGNNDEDE